MPHQQLTIAASDGDCPAYVFTPASGGGPTVIMYMDAGGIRPGALGMAERLADAGYVVLLPDPFYRYGPYGPFDPVEVFKGDFRAILGPLMATTGNAKAAADTAAFLAYLDTRSDVVGRKVGAVGFCMGGGMAATSPPTSPTARTHTRRNCRARSMSRPPTTITATRPRWRRGSKRRWTRRG